MVTIVNGTTKKPVSSRRLARFFAERPEYEGILYIGYPIIGTSEGSFPIDALLVSREQGLVVFNLVEGRDTGDIQTDQDDSYNKLESKLRSHRSLVSGRALQVSIHPVTFVPARDDAPSLSDDGYPVCNEQNLGGCLDGFDWRAPQYYESLVAVIQSISSIRKGRKSREIKKPDSRGAKLKGLEDSIANLDNLQGRAVIETVEGVQRIRGLAGSGKTIILALKAAYLHAQHPEWKIAVTFQTRSLKGQFRRLINTFAIEQTSEEPNWDNIQILHAWGAPGGGDRSGMYFRFCEKGGVEYHDFSYAKRSYRRGSEFDGVCLDALSACPNMVGEFDAILVDEAQDFPPSFLRICYDMLKSEKRLVYAYDELQNLSSESLPSPEEIFGKDSSGQPRVRFADAQEGKPQQDIILEMCYRNPRPLLVTAHALGFGVYRPPVPEIGTGLVQIFDNKQLWKEVGYEVKDGELQDGSEVTLARTLESSPEFLEIHSPIDDLVQFHCFETAEDQAKWVADSIIYNLHEEELRPDDIVVINPDPISTRQAVGPVRKILFKQGIPSHLAGVDTSPDVFFDVAGDSVAFTGIYRAKGNEAGMVYIINAQDCFGPYGNMAINRNQLFTAITRSKAWVRVLGVGPKMKGLQDEFAKVKENNFNLHFRYPTKAQRKHLNIVNRERSEDDRRRVSQKKDEFYQILEDLEAGRVFPEDLGVDQLKRLSKFMEGREG